MKKLFTLSILVMLIGLVSACGVQRPYPLSIELLNSSGGLPYAQQGYQAVRAYSLYDVKVEWDVTETGAHGVQIVAAPGTDYYCDNPVATATLYITNSQDISNANYSAMHNLAQIFAADLSKFKAGRYAFCLKAVMYDSVSSPSLPVFVEVLQDQQQGMGYSFYY
jgi:hypothetical protein